jgi:hypothetical protein
LLRNSADHDRTRAVVTFSPYHDEPRLVLSGDIHKHLRHCALADLRMAVNTLQNQVRAHLVEHSSRLFRQAPQNPARHGINRGVI